MDRPLMAGAGSTVSHVSHEFVSKQMERCGKGKICCQCLGCGRIADSDERESWLHWLALEPPSDMAVRVGVMTPLVCPSCDGTGKR